MATAYQVVVQPLVAYQVHQLYSDHGWFLGHVKDVLSAAAICFHQKM